MRVRLGRIGGPAYGVYDGPLGTGVSRRDLVRGNPEPSQSLLGDQSGSRRIHSSTSSAGRYFAGSARLCP